MKTFSVSSNVSHGEYTDQDVFKKYIRRAVETHGRAPELMIPIIQEVITLLCLLQFRNNNPLKQYSFPPLQEITTIKQRTFASFLFAPIYFWGSTTQEQEYFAACTFEINDIVYENVWIELPILLQTCTYCAIARKAWDDTTLQWSDKIMSTHSVQELLPLVPNESYMKHLQRQIKAI